ncbi:hypothetical protein GCM10010140_08790 [Streptosporangium pseudovulgare]|uniref:Uncharacterized protein n=2 Tax=Streptosporangium pseudovulgare TaxID=35765 RepID=A0ABQ2QIA0_9ACTN|nr:hypothetical protein GCM10010140_08790 [Streptosporangium pseudovulgare]
MSERRPAATEATEAAPAAGTGVTRRPGGQAGTRVARRPGGPAVRIGGDAAPAGGAS